MKLFKLIYISIGLILIIALIFTSFQGVSNTSKYLLEQALDMENIIEGEVWNGYKISKYPIAIRKGNNEYVFFNGNMEKRKATLPVMAFTAYEYEVNINVFMLPFEDLESIIGPSGFSNNSSHEHQYIATIYHEGFHAYQMDNYPSLFELDNSPIDIDLIFEKIDNDEMLRKFYEREGEILYNGINANDLEDTEELIYNYILERERRQEFLRDRLSSDEYKTLISIENFYELIEGTAKYMETKTMALLEDKNLYAEDIESLKDYKKNISKYYDTGMAISLLLDKVDSNWKDSVFKDNKFLFEKLKDSVGGV